MTCPSCGANVLAEARFCSRCGTPIEGGATETERRVVTVLFADLTGFTALAEGRDPEQVKTIIDRAIARLTLVVERYGGRVDKIIGDELMAVFGAPTSFEDDPERAVRAAFAMHAELEALGSDRASPALQVHVGVNTGEVIAGSVGGRDYTVIGDAVNVARRLQEAAAPGQILVGESTRAATDTAITYRALGPIDAKGKQLPVAAFEAVTERGLPGRIGTLETPLIGRREELQTIALAAMLAERDRRPRIVTLVGDPGMGKSKIAAEIINEAARRHVRVVGGRSLPYATVSPGFALEQVVRSALDIESEDADEQIATVRMSLANVGLAGDTDTILAFLGLQDHRSGATGGAPGAGATPTLPRVLEACVRLLVRISRRDGLLIVILNDLQWAEELVLDAVTALLREQDSPILVAALARPALLDAEPGFLRGSGSIVLPLGPLSDTRAFEVLASVAPDVSASLTEDIIRRAGGNPFFLEELARLHRNSPDPSQLPATIHALVAARLDALPPADRRLTQLAALGGDPIVADILCALTGAPVESALERLVEQGFLENQPGGLRFRQKVVREVAIASLPKQVRVERLAHLGSILEERAGATAGLGLAPGSVFEERIAAAFEEAARIATELGEPDPVVSERARHYLARAGDRARIRDASRQAVSWYGRAMQVAPDLADHRLRTRYAEALLGVMRFDEAATELDLALEAARTSADQAGEGRALRLIGDAARMQGRFEASREALERAVQIAREEASADDLMDAERALGMLDLFAGDWKSANDNFETALARAREVGDRRSEAWAVQSLGWTALMRGRSEDAIRSFEIGEAIFAELDDAEGLGWCMGMRAWAFLIRGSLGEAEALLERLDHMLTVEFPGEEANLVMGRRVMTVLRAYLSLCRGDLRQAQAISRGILEEPEWHGQAWAHALAAYPLALSALFEERWSAAEDAIRTGTDAADAGGDPFYRALYRIATAWLAVERGDVATARAELDAVDNSPQVRAAWERSTIVNWLHARIAMLEDDSDRAIASLSAPSTGEGLSLLPAAWPHITLTKVLLDRGETGAARIAAETALATVGEYRLAIPAAHLAAAEAALADEDLDAAITHATAAVETSDEDWLIMHAKAYVALARAYDAKRDHDRADEAFERARALFADLPADTDPRVQASLRT